MKIRAEPKYKTIQIRAEPQGSFLFPLNECTTFSKDIATINIKICAGARKKVIIWHVKEVKKEKAERKVREISDIIIKITNAGHTELWLGKGRLL